MRGRTVKDLEPSALGVVGRESEKASRFANAPKPGWAYIVEAEYVGHLENGNTYYWLWGHRGRGGVALVGRCRRSKLGFGRWHSRMTGVFRCFWKRDCLSR